MVVVITLVLLSLILMMTSMTMVLMLTILPLIILVMMEVMMLIIGSLSNDDGDVKENRFRLAKQQLCSCITLFCTFLCRRCTTTT